jgi:penicillin-insensitive murein endopeptidase
MRQVVRLGALALAGCLAASTLTAGAESVWSRVQSPALGPALAIGGYSSGCVQGALELPARADGTRYRIMKPERKRTFGHPQLIDFITQLGERLEQDKQGPLAVGDLGQARGGPAPNGHASHQNGLDVDLWFAVGSAGAEQYSVVDLEKQKPNEHWSARVPVLLELAARDPHVSRIFVNAVIKRQLCEQTVGDRTWLGKLRPWWGHNEHFHVRLSCPADSPECQPQAPLGAGDGCDEVDWWLSAETAKDRNKGVEGYQKRVGAQPKLPETCQKVSR